MLALTEQSVFTSLLLARPSVHVLLNSPVTKRGRGESKRKCASERRRYKRPLHLGSK